VRAALDEAQISSSGALCERLADYLSLVLAANHEFNLTAVRDFEDAVWLHLVDSLLGLEYVASAPDGILADMGSGAGFPGVPLLMASGREGVLIESVGKKARFLERAVSEIGIPARVSGTRAESVALDEPESCAVVTARALAPLPSILELAAPLLSVGGVLIAYKGNPSDGELKRGRVAAGQVGMREKAVAVFTLVRPEPAHRTLLVYEKAGPSRVPLPRRIGLAQNDPLA
jgi:16S rRNA (guanine527-N7)-methyltransferase